MNSFGEELDRLFGVTTTLASFFGKASEAKFGFQATVEGLSLGMMHISCAS